MEGNSVCLVGFITLFWVFFSVFYIIYIYTYLKKPPVRLYNYCSARTWMYNPPVTETSIFKRLLWSGCFHLHSRNDDRCWCWRPLNGRVANCVWAQLDAQCPSAAAVTVPLRVKVESEVIFLPLAWGFTASGIFYSVLFLNKNIYLFLLPICLVTTSSYG